MPTLLSARSRGAGNNTRGGDGEAGADGGAGGGNRAYCGIAACAVSLLLFCALAVSVRVWMAFTFGGLALVAFGVAGCLARGPSTSSGGAEREAAADAAAAAAPRTAQRRFGLPKAAINALPTFAYEGGGDLESGTAAAATAVSSEPCSVCLEDVQAGEMVRQLPACKHLFHVQCIDMWLHSHRTCPVCRCNLLPPPSKVAAKAAAPAPTTADATEPPADEALPPV